MTPSDSTHVVIMAGGVGSRLWPISTPDHPKQFIDVLGVGRTMIQLTFDRFLPVCDPTHFWVVTGEKYLDMVREQLPSIPLDQILLEPMGRNTAPCISYACRKIAAKYPGANVAVTPSDALVLQKEKFVSVIDEALHAVDGTDRIVTVGIVPTRPETGYGYICSTSTVKDTLCKVSEFKEKPDLETAGKYLEAGNYFWNAGIFVWAAETVNKEIALHAPSISAVMDRIAPSFYTEGERAALREFFPQCEKISIDYAVMEKSPNIYTIASDLGWSDLGTWGSVGEHIRKDGAGNSIVGSDVHIYNTGNCIIHTEGSEVGRVVVDSLDGYIVSLKGGKLLICPIANEQRIREYSGS